jgi:hypothetical protein
MKCLIVTCVVLFAWVSGEAMAACTANTHITGNALVTLISGNTVCASVGNDQWQEQHRAGGQLWDYKKGPNDPVDRTKQVGTWGINTNNVTYSYTGGASYTYSVHGPSGGPYSFCTGIGGTEVVSNATFKTGNSSCP